jgi:hypothetical protein
MSAGVPHAVVVPVDHHGWRLAIQAGQVGVLRAPALVEQGGGEFDDFQRVAAEFGGVGELPGQFGDVGDPVLNGGRF